MSYITTYSKVRFTPQKPKVEDILIEDIAHALSLMCRANGHFKRFYSVAEHSINCIREAQARGYSKKVQFACLLHDASEAYLSDITRPVKAQLMQYQQMEDVLQNLIWAKYIKDPLSFDERKQVFEVDDAILYYEFLYFMQEQVLDYTPQIKSIPDFEPKQFQEVEGLFIQIFDSFFHEETEAVSNRTVVGVDWCKGKWIAVKLCHNWFEVQKFSNIKDLCQHYQQAHCILIDIPIGLPECERDVSYRPDAQIAMALGRKRSSVFAVPFRQIAMADDDGQAWDLSRELHAKMTPPSMGIRKSIGQVDRFLKENDLWKNKLLESHPEYCFLKLNGKPLKYEKSKREGELERIKILERYYIHTQEVVNHYLAENPARKKLDDLLDALCLAVVAKLGLSYGFMSIPENPYCDRTGLKMQILMAKL